MNNLTNPDGPLLKFLSKLVYSVWLNILWFICCIPIFTIGPATTALFYCCQKMVLDEDGYITKAFFHSFKENFKQATGIGLLLTALGIIIGIDGYTLYHLHNSSSFWTVMTAVFIVAAIAFSVICCWIYPLLARFDNTTINMFKNSALLAGRFLLCSAMMLVVYFAMIVIVVRFFTPAIIFGMGTCAFINSMLLKNILIQCERNEE